MGTPHDDIVYGRSALRNLEPWIVPESLTLIKKLIRPDWHIFEWGSGGSTGFWAKNCASVISIEHNSEWIERTSKMLLSLGEAVRKATLLYVRRDKHSTFHNYADAILGFPDESFDLVFIDGEASSRGWCLTNAIPKVKPEGYLLLDNSDWLKRDLGPDWDRQDFVARGLKWIGQKGTFNWWTSVLQKTSAA